MQGVCIPYDMGRYLGRDNLSGLLAFIFGAKEGARLSLQRNRSGFTIQVTEAVQRANGGPVALAATERDCLGRLQSLRHDTVANTLQLNT